MTIDYDHSRNLHTLDGAMAALSAIFNGDKPDSMLDVGCGTGTWLRAAIELGVPNVFGIDGVAVPEHERHVPCHLVGQRDLALPFDLKRRFDVAICLEVAEHLPESCAVGLISSLARHSDLVLFSAACPGQGGQHHVNCQWPAYWQHLFNSNGFECDDHFRWQFWQDSRIEPWYRQNLFLARRAARAGDEPRINSVIHPEIMTAMIDQSVQKSAHESVQEFLGRLENGSHPFGWYLKTFAKAGFTKVARQLRP